MVVRRSQIVSVLLFAFLIIAIFFPGDKLNLKLIFFFLICFFSLDKILQNIMKKKYQWVLLMGVIFPVLIIIQSTLLTGNVANVVSGAYSATLFILVIVIKEFEVPYEKQFMFLLKVMAISTILIVLVDAIGLIDVNENNFLRRAFYNYDIGLMGKSPNYSAYYKVFFKTAPLLVILLDYSIETGDYKMIVITTFALVFSGTRADIFVAAAILGYRCLNIFEMKQKHIRIKIFFAMLLIGGVFIGLPQILEIVNSLMQTSGSVSSDLVREGQLRGYLEVFSDPFNLVFGTGFGSVFFNYGRDAYTASAELSYFEMLRNVGLIFFVLFMVFILKPTVKPIKFNIKVAYIGYLLIAFTNPLLFSSTAYVLYIFMYCLDRNYEKANMNMQIKNNIC